MPYNDIEAIREILEKQQSSDVTPDDGGGGDSDFTLATVTIINNTEDGCTITCPAIASLDGDEYITTDAVCEPGESYEAKIILYKGSSHGQMLDYTLAPITSGVTVTGDVAFNASYVDITGNGTITLAGAVGGGGNA